MDYDSKQTATSELHGHLQAMGVPHEHWPAIARKAVHGSGGRLTKQPTWRIDTGADLERIVERLVPRD